MSGLAPVPNPRPAGTAIVSETGVPTFQFQGWLRSLWNMVNGTLNKGYTGTTTIAGHVYTYQNGVLLSIV